METSIHRGQSLFIDEVAFVDCIQQPDKRGHAPEQAARDEETISLRHSFIRRLERETWYTEVSLEKGSLQVHWIGSHKHP